MNCLYCETPLTGKQTKFCSTVCSSSYWNKQNPDKHLVYKKKWKATPSGKESQKKSRKRYKETESGKVADVVSRKNYKEKNREKLREYKHNRKAIQRKLPVGFTVSDWRNALEFFHNKCAYCGTELSVPHREHFIALSKGGGFTKGNIVPACKTCNQKKGNKHPLDWLVTQAHGLVAYVKVKQYLDGLSQKNY